MTKDRVLLVEDDFDIAASLMAELARLGYDAKSVNTAADAFTMLTTWLPNLLLLDIGLPDLEGDEVLSRIRSSGNQLPVIFLTARDHRDDRIGALRAGADDYVVKPFDSAELDARIQAVLRRSGHGKPEVVQVGALKLMPDEAQILLNNAPLALAPRELHVLKRLIKNAGRVVTKAQLVDLLAIQNEDIGQKSVELYVHRIRGKIEGHDAEIVTVRGFGYLLRSRNPEV